ncbi:hypothetical protein ILUMI_16631 [Ignelater luminosus]|uniref:Uncharacterized protein n=1 Tax=Ignelater luminosus TaxID=2038154 RepID=A0A8K0G5S7_IGNLU|nr:hypothetical protein ILUMI_16631 [Ignelater luminosus]
MRKRNRRLTAQEITADLNSRREDPMNKNLKSSVQNVVVGERISDECIVGTVKHGGGSLMVLGYFGNNKTGYLYRIEETLNKEEYKRILDLPSGRRLIGRGLIFQQDNDPKHSSKLCKSLLSEKERE